MEYFDIYKLQSNKLYEHFAKSKKTSKKARKKTSKKARKKSSKMILPLNRVQSIKTENETICAQPDTSFSSKIWKYLFFILFLISFIVIIYIGDKYYLIIDKCTVDYQS